MSAIKKVDRTGGIRLGKEQKLSIIGFMPYSFLAVEARREEAVAAIPAGGDDAVWMRKNCLDDKFD